MNKNTNYIKQISVLKMKSKDTFKTFAAFNKMFPINENKEDRDLPYDWLAGASRIQFSIIEKNGSVKVCDVNLSANEINDLYDQTKSLYTLSLGNQLGVFAQATNSNETGDTNSPCYTETFRMGTLRGKTPAQVADKETLIKQKDFLAQNVAKYPDNQKLIDAIDDCITKMDNGTLNAGATNSSAGIQLCELINEQEKSRRSVQDKDGNTLVTGIRIACDFTRRLPICVTITNSFAPVNKMEDGRLMVQSSKTVNKQNVFVNLSFKDWNMFITRCQNFVKRYEDYLAPQMFELADKYAWKPE